MEFATGHYEEACMSYREALKLKPGDVNILEALNKTVKEILREKKGNTLILMINLINKLVSMKKYNYL